MSKHDEKRIFERISNNYAVETPYVMEDGEKVKAPLTANPRVLEIKEVLKNPAFVYDSNEGKAIGGVKGNSCGDESTEGLEYKVTVNGAEDKDGSITIGTHEFGYGIATRKLGTASDVTIGGSDGVDSLETLGEFAQHGTLILDKIHASAANKSFFDGLMAMHEVTANAGGGDKPFYWTLADQNSQNTEIREIVFPGGIVLNGMNGLKMAVKQGSEVGLTLYLRFTPNKG